MKNWNVIAIYAGGQNADEETYSNKARAIKAANKKLVEGEQYENISVIADNGEELLDDTEIIIKSCIN